ncbi:TATA box-binding protein associated factor RNA polymerase I subunit C [Quillaja saponaria]|uniref:TATA box-binding protein associated factor RNA polymerase I subunit C n=1 Tax=Quillaja saponaria TaxID=32244 RepID=A0AAD7QD62_QUISA|nr:TATA box-binding protein associated factor RNA polymerase I subunit C [Quillaja saponaria]
MEIAGAMDFSDEWKSLFPINASCTPPLLLSGSSAESILGPLIFNPKPKTLIHLYSSDSLLPPLNPHPNLSLPRFIVTSTHDAPVLPSTASSVSSIFGSEQQNDATSTLIYNRLEFLKYPNSNSVIVFFPTGGNSEQVGFLVLHVKVSDVDVQLDNNDDIFKASTGFSYRILRISANQVANSVFRTSKSTGNSFSAIGCILVYTMYSIYWFVVGIKTLDSSLERPSLIGMGGKKFKTCSIVHACWNPHIREECVVLLESGGLFLFDLEPYFKSHSSNANVKGKRLRVPWNDSVNSIEGIWLSCEFSWHPRILIVARSDAVFLVDLRLDECKINCLVKVEMLQLYVPAEKEQILAFTKASSDGFYFVLASGSFLALCDVRKPMVPVLQWAHGLDRPSYIHVVSLSKLRSHSKDSAFNSASESGFCIILGSFWKSEFNMFCYGSPLPTPTGSIVSKLSKTFRTLYAWELPSEFMLSGHECHCGTCLLREELSKDALPEWIDWQQKKEIVLGFGIMENDFSSLIFESDEFGGFTLIRLMSSGKLELQRYYASWVSVKNVEYCLEKSTHLENHLLYTLANEEYKFPRRFKYLKLDYLCGNLNGNLTELLVAKLKKPCNGPQGKESFSQEAHEILCEKLNACGFGRLRSSSANSAVFNDVSLPASIHEVALKRLWAGLPLEVLQLAFSSYSESLEVLVDDKWVALEFLDVPDLLQLPPFVLRKSSHRSNKWSKKVQRSDAIVGPVLPLTVLLVVHEFRNGCSNLEEKQGRFSAEEELIQQCNEVMQVAREIAVAASGSELHNNHAVSLADDREETWVGSPKPKPFVLYHPVANNCSTMAHVQGRAVNRDKIFDTLISHVREEKCCTSDKTESVGKEMFDDLCPVELKFDTPVKTFGPRGLKAFNVLKRQLSNWQERFDPYKEFQSKFEKG